MNKFLIQQVQKNKVYIKYVIAGGTAASVDFGLLYVLTDILHVWYLFSATIAFAIAFFISFFLQKFWTFRDNSRDRMRKQIALYLMVGATNTCINAGAMYVLVDKFEVWYIFAQAIIAVVLAMGSFLIYRFIIFKKQKTPDSVKQGLKRL